MILPIQSERPLKVLQLTDCHLGAESSETLLGLNVERSFVDVLEHSVAMQEAPDLILVTGDIAGHASAAAYQRFLRLLHSYYPDTPYICIPGNHDDPAIMAEVFPAEALSKSLDLGNWVMVLLDSTIPGSEHGDLNAQELAHLEQTLQENPQKRAMICLHHQATAVGCEWIDQYKIASEEAFNALLARFDNVDVVLWGHVHQDFERLSNGVQYIASPSTCIQFKPNSDDFALDDLMPGYRCFELDQAGGMRSRVERISQREYPIDYNSNGY